MSAFKDRVYWKEQCRFCKYSGECTMVMNLGLLVKRLEIAEADSPGCYGTLSFWCDYFRADEQMVNAEAVQEVDE